MQLPATAAPIVRVECVRIGDSADWRGWTGVPGTVTATWAGAEATELVALISRLPGGGLMRCFSPGYGVRVHDAEQTVFEIAFCFRCHGALVLAPGAGERTGLTGFRPSSRSARELLRRFRAADRPGTELGRDRA